MLQPARNRLSGDPQIVRDIVGNLSDAAQQTLDTIEHAIEMTGKVVEFVACARHRHPPAQITTP